MMTESDSYMVRIECLYAIGAIQSELTRPYNVIKPDMDRPYHGGVMGDWTIKWGNTFIYGRTPDECSRNFDKFWKGESLT